MVLPARTRDHHSRSRWLFMRRTSANGRSKASRTLRPPKWRSAPPPSRRARCRPPRGCGGPRRPRRSRCRALDPPPARDVAGIVREQPELPGRTDHLVVDGSNDPLGRLIHGREGVDDRHDRAVAVVQRVADPGLGQAQQERARGGFKSHRRHSSTSRERDPGRSEPRSRLGTRTRPQHINVSVEQLRYRPRPRGRPSADSARHQ